MFMQRPALSFFSFNFKKSPVNFKVKNLATANGSALYHIKYRIVL